MSKYAIKQIALFNKIIATVDTEFEGIEDDQLKEIKERAIADKKEFGDQLVKEHIQALECGLYCDPEVAHAAHEYLNLEYFVFSCGELQAKQLAAAQALTEAVDAVHSSQKDVEFYAHVFGHVKNYTVRQRLAAQNDAHKAAEQNLVRRYITALEAKCIIPDGVHDMVKEILG